MAGQVAIANQALTDIGASRISALDDDTTEADHVSTVWDFIREEVLGDHNWDFAKKTSVLAQESDYTIDDEAWDYSYALPGDCVSPRYLSDKDYAYEMRENHLLCNLDDGDAILIYTANIEDTTKWPPLFIQAFCKRLSAALCRPLKRKGSAAKDLYGEYEFMLAKAKRIDAAQANQSRDDQYRHTADNDVWLSARTI